MKDKSVYKKALKLAVPMMIQNGITNMVSLIDNIMVGSLGTEAITAVSIIGQLIFVFNLAVFGGISGPGIYGAQYFGQGNKEGLRNTFRIKLWISTIILAAGMSLFIFGDKFLVGLYLHGGSTSVDPVLTMEYARQYLRIMIFGLVPFCVTQVYASSLRETGESVKPMVGGIASVVIDIVFNYLLIYGKFGMPQLGVRGAAIATVLARIVEFAIVVFWSSADKKKHAFLKGMYRTLLVPGDVSVKIINRGTPILLNEFLWAGDRYGAQVVQIYISDVYSSCPKPIKELKRFQKIFLDPGEEKYFEFRLTEEDFSYYDTDYNRFVCEEGFFDIHVATSSLTEDCMIIKRVYKTGTSPYSYGLNSTVKVFFEHAELHELLIKFWNQEGFDIGVLLNTYQYNPDKKLYEILPKIVDSDTEINQRLEKFLEEVSKTEKR